MQFFHNVWVLYKKEMKTYFTSPIAYAILTIFLVIAGFFYYSNILDYMMASMSPYSQYYMEYFNIGAYILRPVFGNLSVIMLFLLPILTMRLIAEERNSGTLRLLLSYPVRDIEIIAAKFTSAVSIVFLMFLLTFPLPLFLFIAADPDVGPFITNYVGLFLLGSAFVSLGLFASSVTERQVVAAVISFGMLILFWVINWIGKFVGQTGETILNEISILSHIDNFTKGVIFTHDIIYYLLFTFFFLFLSLVAMESRTWRSK